MNNRVYYQIVGDEAKRALQHKRILIVDDDPRVLFVLRAALERTGDGYEIETAGNGREALAKLEGEVFDLVITDIRMPGMNGVELVRSMRASALETAVIWITGHGCYALRAEKDRLDIRTCLEKPLRLGEIRQATQNALESAPVYD